jgi:PhnB protein
MASRLNPYISFENTARQAMEFYRDVFGGNLTMNTFGEFGQADSPDADKIMHSQLETEKQMWGDEFGMCMDRFGVPWMVNITQQQS